MYMYILNIIIEIAKLIPNLGFSLVIGVHALWTTWIFISTTTEEKREDVSIHLYSARRYCQLIELNKIPLFAPVTDPEYNVLKTANDIH